MIIRPDINHLDSHMRPVYAQRKIARVNIVEYKMYVAQLARASNKHTLAAYYRAESPSTRGVIKGV